IEPGQTTGVISGLLLVHPGADQTLTFTLGTPNDDVQLGTTTVNTLTINQPALVATTTVIEGPGAGSDTDIVVTSGAWTAVSNDPSWLHVTTPADGNGNDKGVVTFSFDANPGAARTGSLTIAGQTVIVTQAANGYVAVGPVVPNAGYLWN